MTAQKTKPTQKRLNNCVLSPLRWAKIYEKLENCACGTLKIKDAVANAAVRVANAPKKGQARRNTTLLGKYPLKPDERAALTSQDRSQGSSYLHPFTRTRLVSWRSLSENMRKKIFVSRPNDFCSAAAQEIAMLRLYVDHVTAAREAGAAHPGSLCGLNTHGRILDQLRSVRRQGRRQNSQIPYQ